MTKLTELFDQLQKFPEPPLHTWQPNEVLDIDLRIDANGQWYHQGTLIERQKLVKLFSSILRVEENGEYYLITPRLKYPVAVEDVPFQAVELKRQGSGRTQELVFRTNVDDVVLAGESHPIYVNTDSELAQPAPYIEVRNGLRAKISRAVYYELIELLEPAPEQSDNKKQTVGVYSGGEFFAFGEILTT